MSSNVGMRRFEYSDDKSSKFWEISHAGSAFTVRYGKIGTDGQTQSKEFADVATAEKQAQKLIAEKTFKGYQEVSDGTKPAVQSAEATSAEKPAKATKGQKPPTAQAAKALKPADIAKDPESTAEVLEPLAGSRVFIDRLLAKHPKADAPLLEKISHSSDKPTRKAVCLNPNTSKETLIRLAPQFPGEFFQNPAFDWLLLEDPNLLFDIGGGVLKNILKRPECPVSFLKWAASHGDQGQQLAAVMNPHTPVESLRELLKSKFASVVAAARGHAALADEQVSTETDPEAAFVAGIAEALAGLSYKEALDLLEKGYLGKHHVPALAVKVQLDVLGADMVLCAGIEMNYPFVCHEKGEDPTFMQRDSLNPNLPVDMHQAVLNHLASNNSELIRFLVAVDPVCPAEILEKYICNEDEDWDVQVAAITNPSCPEKLLQLFKDDDRYQDNIALNTACPESLLEYLARKGKSSLAPWYVAKNPSCPVELLLELGKNENFDTRRRVAINRSCPVDAAHEILSREILESSPNWAREVNSVEANLDSLLTALSSHWESEVRMFAARHPACPFSILKKLAKDDDKDVRRAVAWNVYCPISLLKTLSKDIELDVVVAVAMSPNANAELIQSLSKSKHPKVRCIVAMRRDCHEETLKLLASDKEILVRSSVDARNADLINCILNANNRCSEWVDREVGFSKFSPPLELEVMASQVLLATKAMVSKGRNHKSALVRALALTQPDLPIEALAKNQKHVSWLVRAAIARNRNCPESVLKALEKDSHQVVAAMAKRSLSQVSAFKNSANAFKVKP